MTSLPLGVRPTRFLNLCCLLLAPSACVAGGASADDEAAMAMDSGDGDSAQPDGSGSDTSSGGQVTVITDSGGSTASGGDSSSGGMGLGATSSGGMGVGGTTNSGGAASGGTSSGGAASGGAASGGTSSGGAASGGTSSGGAASADCTGTFPVLFYDDFEAGSDCWVQNTSGHWVLSDEGYGASQGFEQAKSDSQLLVATAGDGTWENVRIEARVKVTDFDGATSSDIVGLFARYKDEENFYYAALRGNDKMHARKRVANSNSSIGDSYVVPGGWLLETWYVVAFEVDGSTLRMYLDGDLVDEETDTTITGGGYVGIGTVENATVIFDDVIVTSLD